MRALEEKCRSVSVEEPTDMLAVVALAERDARCFVKEMGVFENNSVPLFLISETLNCDTCTSFCAENNTVKVLHACCL